MKNLQEATERICEIKGGLVALDALLPCVLETMSTSARSRLGQAFTARAEAARIVLLHADISELVLAAFERDIARTLLVLRTGKQDAATAIAPQAAVDEPLLATTLITTFLGSCRLTTASGFLFRRGRRLFLVSNRHVFEDQASAHAPDRIEIGLHTDVSDLTQQVTLSLPLHREGTRRWREAVDGGGSVDVAVIDIPAELLPMESAFCAFDETHLQAQDEQVEIGDVLAIVGYPLGFHDTSHHLAVARSACVASAYGIRFQRQGCFLTDARTHRGSSGAPVLRRRLADRTPGAPRSWQLLGVHSTRMDMSPRNGSLDESLGLNCAWYADVLLTLTADT